MLRQDTLVTLAKTKRGATPSALNTLSSTQAQSLFDLVAARLPKNKPTALLSLFLAGGVNGAEDIQPDAALYMIGYGKGCSWRNYATGTLKDATVTVFDIIYEKVDTKALESALKASFKDACTWFAVGGTTKNAEYPPYSKAVPRGIWNLP